MSEETKHPYLKLATTITTVGGAIGFLWLGGMWIYDITDNLATKEYHEHSIVEVLGPIQKSVENNEAAALVPRITNILNVRCKTGTRDLDQVLDTLRSRYKELMERNFDMGGCRNGERISRWEMDEPE